MQNFEAFDGALLVDKPAGPTSHDIVDAVRHHLRLKKVGHCGTLDPNATGLMILLLGKATRLSEKLMSSDKVYEGTARFGSATSSYDREGEVISSAPVPPLSIEILDEAAGHFLGDQMQTPPMVSAVKVGGVPLYKLARKGLEVERKARLVRIYNFRFTYCGTTDADFRVACTKGTYIRTLVHDLGARLGCGAHLLELRRVTIDRYEVTEAIQFEDLIRTTPDDLVPRIIPFLKLAAG